MPKVKEVDYRSRHLHQSPGSAQHMFPTCSVCGQRYNKKGLPGSPGFKR